MVDLHPLPSIYYPDFIAANQSDRADNVINGKNKQADLEHLRKDIRDFKVNMIFVTLFFVQFHKKTFS